MEIDWDDAPVDATHYNRKCGVFYKVSVGGLYQLILGKWITSNCESIEDLNDCGADMIERPKQEDSVMKENVFIRVKNLEEFRAAKKLLASMRYENDVSEKEDGCILYGSVDHGDFYTWDRIDTNPLYAHPEQDFKEIFLPTNTKKHKHHDLIVKWAADTSQKVWWKINGGSRWHLCRGAPSWEIEYEYHIGETPPKETIMIGDVEVSKPVTGGLVDGDEYYFASQVEDSLYMRLLWNSDSFDFHLLGRGLIHLTKEDAIQHAKALIKISGGKVD